MKSRLVLRLFVATALVSVVALVLGGWWVRRAIREELGREVSVDRRVSADGRVEETRNEVVIGPEAGTGRNELAEALDRRLWLALGVVLAGAALATFLIARRILGPIGALERAAARMQSGALATRVDARGDDEMAELGRAFNDMARALEENERLKRDLTNDVAHELRTPLTNLRCHIEALRDGVAEIDVDTVGSLHAEVLQLQRLVEDLGVLAQAESRQLGLAPEAVDVQALVHELGHELGPRFTSAGVSFDNAVPAGLPAAWIDRGRLRQVLTNLIDNAIVHTPACGRIEIGAKAGNRRIELHVRDTGEGIAPVHLPHVFDRFYRADSSRSRHTGGVGLGLAIAKQILLASGGDIAVENDAAGGARFSVRLPIYTSSSH